MALLLAAPGSAFAADQGGPPDTPSAYTSEKVSYDEVGYAGPAAGEGVSASHATLEAGSFAEVTDLDSGRTILVRVTGGGVPANRLAGLSGGALKQLGIEGKGSVPIRIRRTNPPEYERAALAQGQTAKERLGTPPALLNALRKKLAGQPVPKPAAVAAAPKPVPPKKMATRPIARPVPPPTPPAKPVPAVKPAPPKPAPGVDFETAKALPSPRPAAPPPPADASRPHWDEKVISEGGEKFIVEQAEEAARTVGQQRPARPAVASPRPAAPARSAPELAASGGWYVQVGAFANAANARAAAARVGGGIAQAGRIYRVRTGPYASEAAARAALGGLAAKGYRGARVTR